MAAQGPRPLPRPMAAASLVLPGIRRVHEQALPFARAWHAANVEALRDEGPLWVALGDSMSQGIGARDHRGGWVGQLHARLASAGRPWRLVNLSITGARVQDVLDDQLPRLDQLGVRPALVTLLAGANDMVLRRRRQPAVEAFSRLLESLPAAPTVVATLPRRNRHALAINAMVDEAAATGRVFVADMRGRNLRSLVGTRAEDHFHPNERGYATIADAFWAAIARVG